MISATSWVGRSLGRDIASFVFRRSYQAAIVMGRSRLTATAIIANLIAVESFMFDVIDVGLQLRVRKRVWLTQR
jgi:hypothetical protein